MRVSLGLLVSRVGLTGTRRLVDLELQAKLGLGATYDLKRVVGSDGQWVQLWISHDADANLRRLEMLLFALLRACRELWLKLTLHEV